MTLFIGAMPRSGNHLIRGLLDGHPDLAVPPEEDYFLRSLSRYPKLKWKLLIYPAFLRKKILQKLQKDGYWEEVNQGKSPDIFPEAPVFDLEAYYRNFCSYPYFTSLNKIISVHFDSLKKAIGAQQKQRSVSFCALDSDHNDLTNIAHFLNKKDDQFLIILRDPIATYNSGKQRGYYQTVESFEKSYTHFIEEVRALQKKSSVHICLFEELITQTENEMQAICRFLKIPFNSVCTEYTLQGKPTQNNSSFSKKSGIDLTSINRDYSDLSKPEIKKLEVLSKNILKMN